MSLLNIDTFGGYLAGISNGSPIGQLERYPFSTSNEYYLIVGSAGYSNNGVLRIVENFGQSGTAEMIYRHGSLTAIITGFHMRVHDYCSQGTSMTPVISLMDSLTAQITVALKRDGRLMVQRGLFATPLGVGTTPLKLGIWNFIEFKALVDNSNGSYELRINGNTEISTSGIDTQQTGNAFFDGTGFKGLDSLAYRGIIDIQDWYICSSLGTRNNDFLGPGRAYLALATTNGATTAFKTSSGDTNNVGMINETAPDSDVTYNVSTVTGAYDLFKYTPIPGIGSAYIIAAQVTELAKASSPSDVGIAPVAFMPGSLSVGNSLSLVSSYQYRSQLYELNPTTSTSFASISEVTSVQWGYKYMSGTGQARVTKQFVEVWVKHLDAQPQVTQVCANIACAQTGEDLYHMDMVMDKQKAHWTWINDVLALYHSAMINSNGLFKIISERADLPTRMVFGQGNMIAESWALQVTRDPLSVNQAVLEFANKDIDYQRDALYIQDSATIASLVPLKPFNMDLTAGITRRSEAVRLGSIELQRRNTKLRQISFQTDLQALPLEPGDVFAANIPVTNFEMGISGQLVDGNSASAVLDQPFNIQSGKTYELYVWHTASDTLEKVNIVSSPPGTTLTVTPIGGFAFPANAGENYAIGAQSNDVILFRTLNIQRESSGMQTVTGVEYVKFQFKLDCVATPNTVYIVERTSQPSSVSLALSGCTLTISIGYVSPQSGTFQMVGSGQYVWLQPHNPNLSSHIADSLAITTGAASGFTTFITSWYTNPATLLVGGVTLPIVNPGAETGDTSSWQAELGSIYAVASGAAGGFPPAHTGNYFFFAGSNNAGVNSMRAFQRIDVLSAGVNMTAVDSGLLDCTFSGYMRGGFSDKSEFRIRYVDSAIATLGESGSGLTDKGGNWVVTSFRTTIPKSTRFIDLLLVGVKVAGTANDAYFDDLAATVTTSFITGGNNQLAFLASTPVNASNSPTNPGTADRYTLSLNTSANGFQVLTDGGSGGTPSIGLGKVYGLSGAVDITGFGFTQQIEIAPVNSRGFINYLGPWINSLGSPNCGDFEELSSPATVVGSALGYFAATIIPGSVLGTSNRMDISITGLMSEACSPAGELTQVAFSMVYGNQTVINSLIVTLNNSPNLTVIGSDQPADLSAQIIATGTAKQSCFLTYQGISDGGSYYTQTLQGIGTVDDTVAQTLAFGAVFNHINSAGAVHSHNCYSFNFRDMLIEVTTV